MPFRLTRVLPAWLALCIYVLGLFGSLWHAASQPHSVCEHGELVHAQVHATQPPAACDGNESDLARWTPGVAQTKAEQHDHCGLCAPALRSELDTRIQLALRPVPELAQRGVSAPTCREAAFALFLLAPGHSPPPA